MLGIRIPIGVWRNATPSRPPTLRFRAIAFSMAPKTSISHVIFDMDGLLLGNISHSFRLCRFYIYIYIYIFIFFIFSIFKLRLVAEKIEESKEDKIWKSLIWFLLSGFNLRSVETFEEEWWGFIVEGASIASPMWDLAGAMVECD